MIYGTAAALVFNKLFFPNVDPSIGTLAAFGTLRWVSSPARSAARSSAISATAGRKSMLMITMMHGARTRDRRAAHLCADRHLGAGPAGPAALVQGIALGGEWGGASLMVLEHAPAHRRGLFGSLVQVGFPVGLVSASAMFSLVSMLAGQRFHRPGDGVFRS